MVNHYLYAVFSPVFRLWEYRHIYTSNSPYPTLIDEISCNRNDHNLYV